MPPTLPSAAARPAGRRARVAAVLFGVLAATAGCTTVVQQPGSAAAIAPQLTVERFLQAANSRDLAAMARLFGTAQGPIGDTGSTFGCMFKKIGSWFGGEPCVKRSEVEIRLDAIARLLQHDDYRIVGEEPVAGRPTLTRRVLVDLTMGDRTVTGVPFDVVRTRDGTWLVERVDLERVMRGSG
ncbi:MAG: hypothetical protein ACE5GJ_13930 [Gemmatimonadota bacterium]